MHNYSAWRPHDRFYFQDGNVVFRIGNILYNLHRHLFETQSTFFANLFSALLLPNQQKQKDPIVLSELKTVDFDRFLSVLYPSAGIPPPKSKEGLLSVLGLATQWGFASVRVAAVQGLGQVLSREERAMYASKFQVREWVVG
ncbi:hypothetical protein CPC08DRAFT_649801 [Agrocybe pediades]|nr:hypothetical protein CPC08DRAFT_649801 [Agrocybe pediades]